MSIANYLENKVLDKVFRNTDFTVATVYVALHTADPGETGATAEVSGNAYARQSAAFTAASGGATENSADISFPEATGSWGTITYVSLWDASTAGNALWSGALTASRAVSAGITFKILAGDLDVTLD